MERKNTTWRKYIISAVLVLAVALTTILAPVQVEAATLTPKVLKTYVMKKGEKFTLNVYDVADNAKISYKTSKKSVATVSKKGVVTAKKKGKANITVTVKQNGKTYKATTKITVKTSLKPTERVARGNAELILLYNSFVTVLETLGLESDETMVEYANACYEIVELSNSITENPEDYTDEDVEVVIEAIGQMASDILEIMDELSQL